MRDNYDFSDSIPNPYAKKLKKQITLRLDDGTIRYFEELAEKKVFLIKAWLSYILKIMRIRTVIWLFIGNKDVYTSRTFMDWLLHENSIRNTHSG